MPSQNPNDYSMIFTVVGFAALTKMAYDFERFLIADGTPNEAVLVMAALAKLESQLIAIADETAILAREAIQDYEVATRVRPDTGGGGGPRLNDFIGVSASLTAIPGSVGVNHEPTLEDNGVEWWWTNELGYAGHLGRRFIGAFEGTRPDPNRRQEHALLTIGRGPGSGKGTIREPIPEREFVRKGGRHAEAIWHGKVRAAKAAFMAEVRAVTAPKAKRRRPGP